MFPVTGSLGRPSSSAVWTRGLPTMKENILGSLTLLVLLFSFRADAQPLPKPTPRIGYVASTGPTGSSNPMLDAFRQSLRDLGYVDGQNIVIDSRYAEGRLDKMPALVGELVQQKVDIIFAVNNVVIRAAKEATKSTPIVMISSVDPVAAGYIASFAHPGGNITGLAWLNRDISAKRVELLKEVFPKISRLAILWDADGPGPAVAVKEYEAAAQGFKIELRSLGVHGTKPEFETAVQNAKMMRADALIIIGNPLMAQHAKKISDLAIKHHMPTMAEVGHYVDVGALISYGANLADLHRRAAGYIVDILKGAKPGDLAVKLPEKFELSVNLKTARLLDIIVPQHVLIQADKVIK